MEPMNVEQRFINHWSVSLRIISKALCCGRVLKVAGYDLGCEEIFDMDNNYVSNGYTLEEVPALRKLHY